MTPGTISHARSIIKSTELIELLQNNVLDPNAEPLGQNKITAIKVLLGKCIPDLKAIENNVTLEGSVTTNLKVTYVDSNSE